MFRNSHVYSHDLARTAVREPISDHAVGITSIISMSNQCGERSRPKGLQLLDHLGTPLAEWHWRRLAARLLLAYWTLGRKAANESI